jgi:chromosome segregation ATPase
MTDDERQRQMDFIVEQQAYITAKLGVVTEKIDALTVKMDALTVNVDALTELQQRAEERWERTETGIRGLLAIAEVHEREIEALRAAGRETDERLNTLIDTVERIISEGRDGGPRQG